MTPQEQLVKGLREMHAAEQDAQKMVDEVRDKGLLPPAS